MTGMQKQGEAALLDFLTLRALPSINKVLVNLA
jgi:hypothetical protein